MIRLGRITIPAGESKNNTSTATPFEIPATTSCIYLRASANGIRYRSRPDGADPSTVAADADDFPLTAGIAFPENLGGTACGGSPFVVACWNTSGASVDVDIYTVRA